MKKKILISPIILFSAILVVFFYLLLIERNPSMVPSTFIDKKFPAFEADTLLSEKRIKSSDIFKKKITLVNFFATWCKPCRDEHEFIKRFSNNKNLEIIGINYKDDNKKTITWLKELENPYTAIAIDKKGNIAIDWGVYGIPETFVINSNGIIKYRHVGPITEKIYKKINLIIKNIE
jgi:cytochrome c biogenesis protein CcmG/thiol:disulfide interchange protein DsbE